jgi:uncharacterized protein YcbK (DUF882 family)
VRRDGAIVALGVALALLVGLGAALPASREGAAWSLLGPREAHASPHRRGHRTVHRRRRGGGVTPAYRRMRARWHARAPRGLLRAWLASAVHPLVLRPVHGHDTYSLEPDGSSGRFTEAELAEAREAFRYHRDHATCGVHPRLLELVYRAVRHFEVPYVHVISGFRTTRATSRHNQGRALDFVLPGVSDRGLANFLRRQGFVGVGVYPLSGFVHLDVRERSFFWVDSSAPGRRSRVRGVARALALRYDRAARARGEEPVPDLVVGGEGEEGDEEAGAEGEGGASPDAAEGEPSAPPSS